jgi:hypothetical protein
MEVAIPLRLLFYFEGVSAGATAGACGAAAGT